MPPRIPAAAKTIVVDLKGWKFHDGQTVDAQSVIFWMNMMKAEAGNWAGYVPGPQSFPGNIVSYSASSPTALSVTFHLTGAFSPTWFTYNELSQIVPIPEAWDVTSLTGAPGSGGCGKFSSGPMTGAATMKACGAVWKFDTDNNGQSKTPQMASDLSTYGSNKLWLDGPTARSCSPPSTPRAARPPSCPTRTTAGRRSRSSASSSRCRTPLTPPEYSALSSGGAGAPDVGYIPPQDVPQYTGNPGGVGTNASQVAANYNLVPVETWQINYFPYNFKLDGRRGTGRGDFQAAPGPPGHPGRHRPARDHQGLLQGLRRADLRTGAGPTRRTPSRALSRSPRTAPTRSAPRRGWPFSGPTAGACTPAGPDTCAKPGTATGDCGAGISKGTPLSFSEVYESGSVTLTEAVTDEVAQWAKDGNPRQHEAGALQPGARLRRTVLSRR